MAALRRQCRKGPYLRVPRRVTLCVFNKYTTVQEFRSKVDHCSIVQIETLRAGMGGAKSL